PFFVVAGAQVVGRLHQFNDLAELIQVVLAADGALEDAADPTLPAVVEDGLVLLLDHRPEAVHAAHVVDAVHAACSVVFAHRWRRSAPSTSASPAAASTSTRCRCASSRSPRSWAPGTR